MMHQDERWWDSDYQKELTRKQIKRDAAFYVALLVMFIAGLVIHCTIGA